MNRRIFLTTGVAAGTLLGLGLPGRAKAGFEVTRSEPEWRAMLSEIEYYVMREEGTERAGSSPPRRLRDLAYRLP